MSNFKQFTTTSEAITTYGEPDEKIMINPFISHNVNDMLLVYRKENIFVIGGLILPFKDVCGLTFVNLATPYTISDYRITIKTSIEKLREIHLFTGYSIDWTKELCDKICSIVREENI